VQSTKEDRTVLKSSRSLSALARSSMAQAASGSISWTLERSMARFAPHSASLWPGSPQFLHTRFGHWDAGWPTSPHSRHSPVKGRSTRGLGQSAFEWLRRRSIYAWGRGGVAKISPLFTAVEAATAALAWFCAVASKMTVLTAAGVDLVMIKGQVAGTCDLLATPAVTTARGSVSEITRAGVVVLLVDIAIVAGIIRRPVPVAVS